MRWILAVLLALGLASTSMAQPAPDSLEVRRQAAVIKLGELLESLRGQQATARGTMAVSIQEQVIAVERLLRDLDPAFDPDRIEAQIDSLRAARRARIDSQYARIEVRIDEDRRRRHAQLEANWGRAWTSNKSYWVARQDDDKRIAVDFEGGTIEAEVRSADGPVPVALAKEALLTMFREATRDIEEVLPLSLRTDPGVLGASTVDEESPGRVRVVLRGELVPDAIDRRAQKYLAAYAASCQRHGVPLALALAVGRAESSFFPEAISRPHRGGHSYGMMQIVHRWAGSEYLKAHPRQQREFYRGADEAEQEGRLDDFVKTFWFDAERNIDAGVWFLGQLDDLDVVAQRRHAEVGRYLQICSYNAGSTRAVSVVNALGQDADDTDPACLLEILTAADRDSAETRARGCMAGDREGSVRAGQAWSKLPDETRTYLGNVERFLRRYRAFQVDDDPQAGSGE